MALFEFFYNNRNQKQTIIDRETALGRRKLKDNFLEDDEQGGTRPVNNPNGDKGQLIFTDDQPSSEPTNRQLLTKEALIELFDNANIDATDIDVVFP